MVLMGLILGTFGLVLLNFGNPQVRTSAEETYTSTWKATKILTVEGVVGTKTTGEAGIGVWEWRVDGIMGGVPYTETWSAPSLEGVAFVMPNNRGCNIEGVDPGRGRDNFKILAGCITSQGAIGGSDTTQYNFKSKTVSNILSKKARVNEGTGYQDTTSCIVSPRNGDETECVFQSGPYSFQHVHEIGSNARMRWLGSGTLMPLTWEVTGSID